MSTFDPTKAAYEASQVVPPPTANTLASPTQLASGQTIGTLIVVPSYNNGANNPTLVVPSSPTQRLAIVENVGSQSVFLGGSNVRPDPNYGVAGHRIRPGEIQEFLTDLAIYGICIGQFAGTLTPPTYVLYPGEPGGLVIVSLP